MQARLVHGKENAAVHGFHAVANIGERPCHDDAHCIVQIGLLHFMNNL